MCMDMCIYTSRCVYMCLQLHVCRYDLYTYILCIGTNTHLYIQISRSCILYQFIKHPTMSPRNFDRKFRIGTRNATGSPTLLPAFSIRSIQFG